MPNLTAILFFLILLFLPLRVGAETVEIELRFEYVVDTSDYYDKNQGCVVSGVYTPYNGFDKSDIIFREEVVTIDDEMKFITHRLRIVVDSLTWREAVLGSTAITQSAVNSAETSERFNDESFVRIGTHFQVVMPSGRVWRLVEDSTAIHDSCHRYSEDSVFLTWREVEREAVDPPATCRKVFICPSQVVGEDPVVFYGPAPSPDTGRIVEVWPGCITLCPKIKTRYRITNCREEKILVGYWDTRGEPYPIYNTRTICDTSLVEGE